MKRHYTSLYFLFFSILFFPLILKGIEPVGEVRCEPGGEFGNIVTLKLSKDFRYGRLTIKRTLAGSDLTKDIGSFVGGDYRLDLATKEGITGYLLEYAAKDPAAALTTTEGAISCGAVPVSTTQAPTPVPEAAPAPAAPTVPPPSPPPVSAPEPVPQVPIAPVTAPTEAPTTPGGISVEAGRLPTPTTSTTPQPSATEPSATEPSVTEPSVTEPSQAPSPQPEPSSIPVTPPQPTTTEPDFE